MSKRHLFFGYVISSFLVSPAFAQQNQNQESLEQEIRVLKQQYQQMEEKLNATVDMIENTHNGANTSTKKTRVGGYGELHYNNWQNKLSNGENKKELDFHRFVLFFGHDFNDNIRFFSELELEHAFSSSESDGEVELEQAYIEFDVADNHSVKGGLFLIPVGILNETHEPPTFYGVERNPVEKNIIPSTWWECGAAANGHFSNGISTDIAVTSGLMVSTLDEYTIRDGRQKCSKAVAEDLALTARFKWTGIAGLELAATLLYQDDVTQNQDPTAGAATLFESHIVWTPGAFGLRALYANWNLDGSGPSSIGANKQTGWYFEPSYRFTRKLGAFIRYNDWDNKAGNSSDSSYTQIDVGINYWPVDDVVIKVDYQDQSVPTGNNEFDRINLGIGYQF